MEEKPRPGQPAVLSAVVKRFARKQLKKPGFDGGDCAARVLHSHAHTTTVVHNSTLSRMLEQRARMHPSRLVPVSRRPPACTLTDHDKQRRLEIADANKSRDWSSIVLTGRKSLCFWYPGSKVPLVQLHEQGDKRQVVKPTNPQCVHGFIGISKYGTKTAIQVAGSSKHKSPYNTRKSTAARSITAAGYKDELLHPFCPRANSLWDKQGTGSGGSSRTMTLPKNIRVLIF
jgi:hypothetical protein